MHSPQSRNRRRHSLCEVLENRLLFARPLGIDVSHWQGTINWTSVKNSGKEFAFIKSSGSDSTNSYTDSKFATNAANAVAAGLIVGVYHFADPTASSTAAQQAQYFMSVAGSRMTTGYLPPVLDLEVGEETMTVAQYTQWAADFCTTIYNAIGVRPLIYTGSYRASHNYLTSISQWPLWIANWPSNPDPQTGNPTVGASGYGWPAGSWKVWQYSSTGTVPGITGNVDLDVFQGDSTTLQNFRIGAPEVATAMGSSNIVDGSSTPLSFGSIVQGQAGSQVTFTVTNTGGQILNLSGLSVPTGYSILEGLSPSLLSGQSDTFTVRLDSATVGTKTGQISFNSNDSNESPFNFAITGTVTSSTILNAPANMSVTLTLSNSISIAWTDASSGEQSYLIERKQGAGGAWSQIANIAANSSSHTDSGAQPGTNYVYRVRVYGGGTVYGAYGGEVQSTTYAAVPTGLTATDGDFTSKVHLQWDASAAAVSYQVFRSTSNDIASAALLAPSATTSYDDAGALPDTTYYYWVAARDSLNRLSLKGDSDSGFKLLDVTPPLVSATSFEYQSVTQSVAFTFSEDVSLSLDPAWLTVTRDGSPDPVGVSSITWDANTNTAYFELEGPLADDNYHAVLDGQFISDLAGNPLGGTVPVDFFYLLADANHDGSVDTVDFNTLAANFGGTGKTFGDGDFNYDGTIDSVDFNLLASRFGNSAAGVQSRSPSSAAAAPGAGPAPTSLFGAARIGRDVSDEVLI